MTGLRLQWKVFNKATITPTIIGDGLEALRDLSINADLRYEIHTAMGTRHLLEDENYATAYARERQFYTQTIVPDARLIQVSINNQVLHPLGYHLEFEPQRLESFQEDEGEQATAFMSLVKGLSEYMSVEAAFQIASNKMDYQFSEDEKAIIAQGIQDKKDNRPPQLYPEQPQEPIPPAISKALVELNKWEDKVRKAGKMVTWYPAYIPAHVAKAVNDERMTFDEAHQAIVNPEAPKDNSELKALAEAINKAAERVEQQPITINMPPVALTINEKAVEVVATPAVTVTPVQQPPVVNVTNEVKVEPTPVTIQNDVMVEPTPVTVQNDVTVQPADVVLPPFPTEAEITTDKQGRKKLKVK